VMRFNLPSNPSPIEESNKLEVGNVYAAKGGKPTRYWVCVGIRANTAILIGLDAEGVLCSATTYSASVFEGSGFLREGRPILGCVEGLEDLTFDIAWREKV
jgi:hypothetical protein